MRFFHLSWVALPLLIWVGAQYDKSLYLKQSWWLALGAACGWAIWRRARQGGQVLQSAPALLFCALLVAQALSFPGVVNPGLFAVALAQVAAALMVTLFLAGAPDAEARIARLAQLARVPLTVVVGLALVAIYLRWGLQHGTRFLHATFENRNTVAVFLVALLPLHLLAGERSRGLGAWFNALLTVAAIHVAISLRTRASWVMLIVLAIVLALRWRSALKRLLPAAAIAILAAVALPNALEWSSPTPLADSAQNLMSWENSSGRNLLWPRALEYLSGHPAGGMGAGQYRVRSDEVAPRPGGGPPLGLLANSYLEAAVELGVLGGLVLLALGLGLPLARLWSPRPPVEVAAYAGALLVGVGCVFQSSFFYPPLLLLFATSIAAAERRGAVVPRGFSRALAAGAAALLLIAALTGASQALRVWAVERGAPSALRAAFAIWPWDAGWQDALASRAYVASGPEFQARFLQARRRHWPRHAGPPPPLWRFAQAQAHLASWQGRPLISADYSGRYQPYVWREGVLAPVLGAAVAARFPRLDFIKPLPLSGRELILAGIDEATGGGYRLFRHSRSSGGVEALQELFVDEPARDRGDACIEPGSRRMAWSADGRKIIGEFRADGSWKELGRVPRALGDCVWLSARSLLAAQALVGQPTRLWKCEVGGGVRCRDAGKLADDAGAMRRFGTELPRAGSRSYYWAEGMRTPDSVVYKARAFGKEIYGIVASSRHQRALARWSGSEWRPLLPEGASLARWSAVPEEIWLRTRAGRRVQAFYFGPLEPSRVVIWWHGASDNVSPRYHPYFEALNQAGYGVLALNYPGSVGRGPVFRADAGEEAQVDAARAAVDYLLENRVRRIVSWALSAGSQSQGWLIKHGVPVSAAVDQVGTFELLEQLRWARERGLPFFSIRGRHDSTAPAVGTPGFEPDFVYEGGHDIRSERDFREMMSRVVAFLERARDVPAPAPETPALILDPGHDGHLNDGNRVGGLREAELAFGMAEELARECGLPERTLWTRTGSRSLLMPARSLKRRSQLVLAHPAATLVSLHFNAFHEQMSERRNLASVFVPLEHPPAALAAARAWIAAFAALGLPPKPDYQELGDRARKLEDGVYARELAVLPESREACRLLLEPAYYEDPEENARLAVTAEEPDGSLSRPRLRELARASCPALKLAIACGR